MPSALSRNRLNSTANASLGASGNASTRLRIRGRSIISLRSHFALDVVIGIQMHRAVRYQARHAVTAGRASPKLYHIAAMRKVILREVDVALVFRNVTCAGTILQFRLLTQIDFPPVNFQIGLETGLVKVSVVLRPRP